MESFPRPSPTLPPPSQRATWCWCRKSGGVNNRHHRKIKKIPKIQGWQNVLQEECYRCKMFRNLFLGQMWVVWRLFNPIRRYSLLLQMSVPLSYSSLSFLTQCLSIASPPPVSLTCHRNVDEPQKVHQFKGAADHQEDAHSLQPLHLPLVLEEQMHPLLFPLCFSVSVNKNLSLSPGQPRPPPFLSAPTRTAPSFSLQPLLSVSLYMPALGHPNSARHPTRFLRRR